MARFEDFFEIVNKIFQLSGLDLYASSTHKHEKWKIHLKNFIFWCLFSLCVTTLLQVIILAINKGAADSGPEWANIFLVTLGLFKTAYTCAKWNDLLKLKEKLKSFTDDSIQIYSKRYKRSLKINNVRFMAYVMVVHGSTFMFSIAPIVQNTISIINGNDTWNMILPHNVYFPYDYNRKPLYMIAYIHIVIVSFTIDNYFLINDILFGTLTFMLSLKFDSLGDDLQNIDFRKDQHEKLKKLIDQHNELLDISKDLDNIYNIPILMNFIGSSILICFSLLQLFMQDLTLANILNLLKFGAYLTGTILQNFILCYFSEKLKTSSEDIGNKFIRSNWQDKMNTGNIKCVQLILLRSQRPVELTALKFFGVDLNLFTHVGTHWKFI